MTDTDTPAAPAPKRSFLGSFIRGFFRLLGALSYAFIRVFFFILFSPPMMFLAAVFVLIIGWRSGALLALAKVFVMALVAVIEFAMSIKFPLDLTGL